MPRAALPRAPGAPAPLAHAAGLCGCSTAPECETRYRLRSSNETVRGEACPSAECARCNRRCAVRRGCRPRGLRGSGTRRTVHCHECILWSFPGSAARISATAACRPETALCPVERSESRAYSSRTCVFRWFTGRRRCAPALHQSMRDTQLVQYPGDDEVDQVLHACRAMIKPGVRGQDHGARMREAQHVLEMDRRERRLTRYHNQRPT